MTRDELYRKRMMFQIYSSRNQMPKFETNANNEPLKHSATNDYLEYRKKVAAGVRMQKENDKSNLFNVTEANEQYYQDLMDQNIIVHAGTYKPAGTHEYVAVLPDFWGKGKHRYFYTQEEWDSYNKNKAASGQAGAQRGAKEGADAKNKALASAGQKAYESSLSNPAKNAFGKAITNINNKSTAAKGQKAYEESQKNNAYTQAQSGREAAIANSKGGSKEYDEEAQNITNTVKNYGKNKGYAENAGAARGSQEAANGNKESNFNTNQKQSANQSGNANAAKAQGEAYDKYMADKKQSANQSGSANAAKAQGEAYDQYMQEQEEELANIKKSVKDYNASRKEWEKNSQANPGAQRGARESELVNNQKQSANQSGSANAAKAQGEGYDRYQQDLADREELRRQVEQEEINAENYAKNKSDSKGIDKAAKDRAIKESADSILNSKNPAKEIANNKTISKDIDVIVDMLNEGVADFNKDGRIHIDKSKNPKAVEYIANSDLGAMYNALLQGGMSKRSIDAAINDEIEKRYNASKESKVQNAVGKFAQKGGQRDIANAVKGMSDSKAQYLAANQSGSGNAAKEAGERQDADKAKKAREEEDAKAKRYDDRYEKNNGKKRYATSVKHFAFEEDDEETEEITPEQEYLNFRAKVEAGMKHFGMTRGLMSVPVNQGLKNGESLAHAGYKPSGTHEYVAVLPDFWGKGKHRYFYTQQEWDNYNKNKAQAEGSKKAEQNKENKKNPNIQKQLDENYSKNEAAAKAGYGKNLSTLSKWQKDQDYYNDKESSLGEGGPGSWHDEKIYKFLKVINGTSVNVFDDVGFDNLHGAIFKGKDSEEYKNLKSRIQKNLDTYDREIDKFSKYLDEKYPNKFTSPKNDAMQEAEKINKETKETYKDLTENYDEWRETKIKENYSNALKNGLTNYDDLAKFKQCGYDIDAFVKMAKEKWDEFGYDKFAQDILKDILYDACKVTLDNLKK